MRQLADKLISANALIEDLLNKDFYPAIVKRAIEEAPAVEPDCRWIPVSDLPKETGHYLVNLHEEDEYRGATDCVVDTWYQNRDMTLFPSEIGWTLLNEFYHLTEQLREHITHWMPLPEPPKENDNDIECENE